MRCPEIFETVCYNKRDHFLAKIVKQSIQRLPLFQLQFNEKEGAHFHNKWRVRVTKEHCYEDSICPLDYVYDIGWQLYDQAEHFEKDCEECGSIAKIIYCGDYFSDVTQSVEHETVVLHVYFDVEGIANTVKKLRADNLADDIVSFLRACGCFAAKMQ